MKSLKLILLTIMLIAAVFASAREFRIYGIGESVNKFPELAAYGTAGEMILYGAPDVPAQYNGIFSPDLKIVADKESIIRAKSLSVIQKPQAYALEVFDAWVERLSEVLDEPTAILVEGVPSDHPQDLETILKDFQTAGTSLNAIFLGKTSTNIVTLKRYPSEGAFTYDVTVYMTDK